MRVYLSERTNKPNNGYMAKHGAIIEFRVSLLILLHQIDIWSCFNPGVLSKKIDQEL